MRFHAIQNVETALRFLRYKEIKLVNIRGEDIVDGNPKLTLGLIWTIILHFQVGKVLNHANWMPPLQQSHVFESFQESFLALLPMLALLRSFRCCGKSVYQVPKQPHTKIS